MWQLERWTSYPWLIHGFTTRRWGNLALHTGADPNTVLQSRKALNDYLDLPGDSWVVGNQVHGKGITLVTDVYRGRGALDHGTALPDTDGMITADSGLFLVSFYADCAPLLFVLPQAKIIGMAHAGWRGTAAQIGPALVDQIKRLHPSGLQDVEVAIGPAIGPCCYRVGREVAAHFPEEVLTVRPDGLYLDLPLANKLQLIAAGVDPQKIYLAAECTYCHHRYFSFRREGKTAGRMGAFLYLK